MCGIAGIVRFDGQSPAADELLRMTQALAHRGPDGHGTFIRDSVGLGHRRLSIIDLELGRQPMANEDQTVWVTFNGEIYNFRDLKGQLIAAGHQFKTDCDTEVIVHGYEQWGAKCVEKFRGMFAFAVVDFRARTMLLARDHFGIKPLYYRLTREYLAFASELSALKQTNHAPLRGSLASVELFLRYQYIPTPHTIYQDVFKLPPAHVVELRLDGLRPGAAVAPRRYWDLQFGEGPRRTEQQWLDQVDEVVSECVRDSLVADVPFGVFLSGGVDSTLVAQKMRDALGGEVKAFTIGFEEETYSELPYARQAARQIGLEWEHEIVRPDALAVLPDLLEHYGEPYGDSSAIPTWYVCRLARQHVPMVLSGDGGDEIFGGYGTYRSWMTDHESDQAHRAGRPLWKKGVLAMLGRLGYDHDRALTYSLERWLQRIYYVQRDWRLRLWQPAHHNFVEEPCKLFATAAADAPQCDPLSFVQYLDFQTYLPCDILTKVDVASMYHALEVRPSLLDVRLVELAAQMPLALRMHRNGSPEPIAKYALKATLGRHFAPAFVHRRKQGFAIPRDRWFLAGQPTRRRLDDIVRQPNGRLGEFFRRDGMEALLAAHTETNDYSGPLWLLLVLGLWLEQNREVSFA